MVAASKSLATFTIEPLGNDIYNPTSYDVRERFQETDTVTNYPDTSFANIFDIINTNYGAASTDVGCRIHLKNGLYKLGQGTSSAANVELSNSIEGGHIHFVIEGESREGTIIRNTNNYTATDWRMFLCRCSVDFENLTLDGDNLGAHLSLIEAYGNTSQNAILKIHNCKLTKNTGFGARIGTAYGGCDYSNNIFEKPATDRDQCTFGGPIYSRVIDNYFDRTNGAYTGDGSSITSGGATRARISGNLINRIVGNAAFGISIEGFDNYDGVVIDNNIVQNGAINVDGSDPAYTTHNIKIIGNLVKGGGLRVLGPTTNTVNKVKYVTVENNTLIDSKLYGMKISFTGGRTVVRGNVIVNSNAMLDSSSIDRGLVRLESCNDLVFEDNILEMNVTSPENANFSWNGIRYESLKNCIVRRNIIVNKTLANTNYSQFGSHIDSQILHDI
jgi:hypothetical protein